MKKATLIDWECKGNLVRLYFGNKDKAWGDDWNDAPYEHNAGRVYSEFVEYAVDIAIRFDFDILEPCYGYSNSPFTKEHFLKGDNDDPCLIILEPDQAWRYRNFEEAKKESNGFQIFMGLPLEEIRHTLEDFEGKPPLLFMSLAYFGKDEHANS